MTKKFDVYKWELVDILIKRANALKEAEWSYEIETNEAIENVEVVLNEYKQRAKKYLEEHQLKSAK